MSTKTRVSYVPQYEHDGSRAFEDPCWEWIDEGSFLDEAAGREYVRNRRAKHAQINNRFTRAFRLVKRTTVTTDEVIENA